ncbi:MAG TPA: hypothetical protein VMG60_11335 [Burkholderiaceae bacterium]|nr:hypothetical protein [Burkholderiaceae bacterium]
MNRIKLRAIDTLPRALGMLSLVALLAACGGGGGMDNSQSSSNSVSSDAAKNLSANTAVTPNDSVTAMSAAVSTAETVVAAGLANVTIACPGGGTAVYQVTGPDASLLLNHQLDQGEDYTLTYNACSSASGAASVNGSLTLFVKTKTADSLELDMATNNVVVTLPHGDVTLNGSSTLTRTIQTAGSTTTTTTQWVTPNFSVTSNRNGRTTSFSYSNVDLTRTVVTTNGAVTSTSFSGTATLTWTWPGGSFAVTLATQGSVGCDADGTPTQGIWSITLPNDRITVTIVPGTVTIAVDYGNDGTIDRLYTFTVTDMMNNAG